MEAADKLAYACGGIVAAGLLYLILALLVKAVGVRKVMRFLPPVGCLLYTSDAADALIGVVLLLPRLR